MGMRRLFWLAVSAVLVYGIYLTDSRGTLLALLVLLGIYIWRKRGIIVAGMLGAAALGGLMMLPSRLQDVDVSEESAFGRVDSWYEGLQMFMSNPVFGVGPGNYSDYNTLTAHNSFMLVLAETGYLGFTVWLAFVCYGFWMMLVVMRSSDDDLVEHEGEEGAAEMIEDWHDDRRIAFTLLLSLCGFFAAAFFLSRSYVVTLYLLMALVVAHYYGMQQRYGFLPRFGLGNDLLRWPLVSVAAIAGLFIVVKTLLAMA
jgi:O-antigen ligase